MLLTSLKLAERGLKWHLLIFDLRGEDLEQRNLHSLKYMWSCYACNHTVLCQLIPWLSHFQISLCLHLCTFLVCSFVLICVVRQQDLEKKFMLTHPESFMLHNQWRLFWRILSPGLWWHVIWQKFTNCWMIWNILFQFQFKLICSSTWSPM